MKIVLCSDFKLCRKCIPSTMPKWKHGLHQRGVLLIALLRKATSSSCKYYVCCYKGLDPMEAGGPIRSGFVSGAVYCFLLDIAVALELPAERPACSSQSGSPSCLWLASKPADSWVRTAGNGSFPRPGQKYLPRIMVPPSGCDTGQSMGWKRG